MAHISVADVVDAYDVLKPAGWKPSTGDWGQCESKRACAIGALALKLDPTLSKGVNYLNGNACNKVVREAYGVVDSYIRGFIVGFDTGGRPLSYYHDIHTNETINTIRYVRGYNRGLEAARVVFGTSGFRDAI